MGTAGRARSRSRLLLLGLLVLWQCQAGGATSKHRHGTSGSGERLDAAEAAGGSSGGTIGHRGGAGPDASAVDVLWTGFEETATEWRVHSKPGHSGGSAFRAKAVKHNLRDPGAAYLGAHGASVEVTVPTEPAHIQVGRGGVTSMNMDGWQDTRPNCTSWSGRSVAWAWVGWVVGAAWDDCVQPYTSVSRWGRAWWCGGVVVLPVTVRCLQA